MKQQRILRLLLAGSFRPTGHSVQGLVPFGQVDRVVQRLDRIVPLTIVLLESGTAPVSPDAYHHVVLRVLLGDGDERAAARIAVVRGLFGRRRALTRPIECELNRLLIPEQRSFVVICSIVTVVLVLVVVLLLLVTTGQQIILLLGVHQERLSLIHIQLGSTFPLL